MLKIHNLKNTPEHLTTLAQWHQKEWSYLNPGESIEQRITRMQHYLNDNFIPSTYIAKDTGLLGSAAIVEKDMETTPQLSPWLASVFVAPAHRQNSVATKLILHIVTQAKNKGIQTLYLYTPDKTDFYQKLGWKNLSTVQYHGHQVTIMQLALNDK